MDDAEDIQQRPTLPDMSWAHWHAACAFCMAGVDDAAIGQTLKPWSKEQWEAANDFYGNLHVQARHPTALPFSEELYAWQRQFFLELLEREETFDTAPFDPRPFLGSARGEGGAFDFDEAVKRVRDAVYAAPHLGPFRDVPWKAEQIGQGVSDYAAWLFRDGRQVYLYGKPLQGKDGRPLEGIDPGTFRMVGQFFAVDNRQGYALVQNKQFPYIDHVVPLPDVDPQRFTALNHAFAADGSAVYHRSGKRLTKDVRGFELLPGPAGDVARSEKAQDGKRTYVGDKALEGRSWSPASTAAPCPVQTIDLDDHIILPPAYRLFAVLDRDADGHLPRGLDALVHAVREALSMLFRTGRIMVRPGRFPRVKLTPTHWDKLEASLRHNAPHEPLRAELYDRLDHHGLAAETPAACLDAAYDELTIELALPPTFDWALVDASLWPHLETLPVRYAVQGYGMATELRHGANRDTSLHALAVREQCVCGLGLQGGDMARFTARPEQRHPKTRLSPEDRPIPDLGFKTLLAPGTLDAAEAKRLAALPGGRVSTASNGGTVIQLGDAPIWGVDTDEAALVEVYRQARSVLSHHRLTEERLKGNVYGDWTGPMVTRYLKDWR